MNKLEALQKEADGCTKCRLSSTVTNHVFGEGKTDKPMVMFIGEGPGEIEDRTGRPFVGPAGLVLRNKIIETKLQGEVYVANIVKCRCPENREPQDDEIKACIPWLAKQVAAIDPTCIVSLGNVATRALLGNVGGITHINGRLFHTQAGRPVVPIIHPAATLHNPEMLEDWNAGFDALDMHLLKIIGCPF